MSCSNILPNLKITCMPEIQKNRVQYNPATEDKVTKIFHVLVIGWPTQEEIDFVETIINGGKTDNTERASSICGYLNEEGKEKFVYNILES
jgi:hypothetical protein